MSTNLKKTILGIVIGVGFIAFTEWYVGWGELLAPWREAALDTLIISLLLVFSSYWMRTLRLYFYFRVETTGAVGNCFKLVLQHNLLNNLLPMRTGEISFPVLMYRYFNIPAIRSAPALLWFRILDFHTLVLIGLIALGSKWYSPLSLGAFGFLWLLIPWAVFSGSGWCRTVLVRVGGRRIRPFIYKVLSGLPTTRRSFLISWWWTFINWIVKVAAFTWILLMFVDTSMSAALTAVIAGDLTSVLPVHGVAGLGSYEAGVVSALLPHGVGLTDALRGAVNVHLFLLAASLLGGVVSFVVGRTSQLNKVKEAERSSPPQQRTNNTHSRSL